jgi:hypothetical protein
MKMERAEKIFNQYYDDNIISEMPGSFPDIIMDALKESAWQAWIHQEEAGWKYKWEGDMAMDFETFEQECPGIIRTAFEMWWNEELKD